MLRRRATPIYLFSGALLGASFVFAAIGYVILSMGFVYAAVGRHPEGLFTDLSFGIAPLVIAAIFCVIGLLGWQLLSADERAALNAQFA
jgi:hypothetical protein